MLDHRRVIAPSDPRAALREAVGEHGVAPPADSEPGIEYETVFPQLPHVQQQVAGRGSSDNRAGGPAPPFEYAARGDPGIDRPGEYVLHRTRHGGVAPCLPGADQCPQPPVGGKLVVVDEHQRIGIAGLRHRSVSRRRDAGQRFMNVPHSAIGEPTDRGTRSPVRVVVHDDYGGRWLDAHRLGTQRVDGCSQRARTAIGRHGNDHDRAIRNIDTHLAPPPSPNDHDRAYREFLHNSNGRSPIVRRKYGGGNTFHCCVNRIGSATELRLDTSTCLHHISIRCARRRRWERHAQH